MKKSSTVTLKSYVRRTVFNDENFIELSDSAKLVYLYFLMTPRTIQCLGIIPMGPVGVLEGLSWGLERAGELLKILDELEVKGMIFCDRKKNIVFVPETVRSNPPSNDNIVKGWAVRSNEVQDCEVKDMWIECVRQVISDTYPDRLNVFDKVFFAVETGEDNMYRKGNGKGIERGDGLFQTVTGGGVDTGKEKEYRERGRGSENPPPRLHDISFSKDIPTLHVAYLDELEKIGFDRKKAIDWKGREKRMICELMNIYGVDKCFETVRLFVRTFPATSVKKKWDGSPTIPLLHSWRDYYFNSSEFKDIATRDEYSGPQDGFGKI